MLKEIQEIEMNQRQQETLLWYLENMDFLNCLVAFKHNNGLATFGIKKDNLLGNLSDEDIMTAWVFPDLIKLVND